MIPKPLDDRIVVQRDEQEYETKGGIHIPDTAQETSQEALVVAVGPGKVKKGQRQPVECKVGDRVVIAKYGGTDITYDGMSYAILRDEDVLAIIEETAVAV